MKKALCLLISTILICSFLFTACKTDSPETQRNSSDFLKVALVITDKLGDKSFFDSAHDGILKASKEIRMEYKVFECNSDRTLYSEKLIEAAKYANIVVAVGYEYYDIIQEIATGYPNVNFIYPDQVIEGIPNLTCIDYTESEGAFLAGALAALMTVDTSIPGINDKSIIGLVGGMDIPVIREFEKGYIQGAKYINPDIIVEVVFTGDFSSPEKGKQWADILYRKEADIIFAAAGAAGLGVYDSAKENLHYAIGVDSDQRYMNPDHIIASMTKGVGLSIYESIRRVQTNSFKAGTVYKYGITENGVNLSYGDESMRQIVPKHIMDKIDEIKQGIVSGEIKLK